MEKSVRIKNFKLGRIHGRLLAENPDSEAQIQRIVVLSQKLQLWRKRNDVLIIRIFGYEVPLERGKTRGRCVDLMGYDKEHNLYLIELKKEESPEQIFEIAEQVAEYEMLVQERLPYIEQEFFNEFFFPIKFKSIKSLILAPRKFYTPQRNKALKKECFDFSYFRDLKINQRKPGDVINIHLKKK